jgi:GLPGLI family protein
VYLKTIISILFCFLILHLAQAQQRIVAECTVVYKVETQDADNAGKRQKATKTVYIKSNNARVELVSQAYAQTTIYNKTTATAAIIRTIGGEKYMTTLSAAQWQKLNKLLDSTRIVLTTDSLSILDYSCKKAILYLKDNSEVTVYYTTNIIPSVREYEYMFKDIPGFVLGYEMLDAKGVKTSFKATQINLYNPVPSSKFDIPTKRYRLIKQDTD